MEQATKIVVTGSLAYDVIMTYPGHFKDHIVPEKIPSLSVSFMVDSLKRNFGGTAGNIAYTARLLGLHTYPMGTAGNDFAAYAQWLKDNSISNELISMIPKAATAQAFIITDQDDSQIAAFHPGAMSHAQTCSLRALKERPKIVMISANGIEAMVQYIHECKELKIPYFFDPGQGIPALEPLDLKDGILHAQYLATNEYEMHMLCKKIGMTTDEVRQHVPVVIVTHGAKGSTIYEGKHEHSIPIAYATRLVDPTGCGDAYRAGILFGIERALSWPTTGKIAALAAVYAVEKQGTQNHSFAWDEFSTRYRESFGEALNL